MARWRRACRWPSALPERRRGWDWECAQRRWGTSRRWRITGLRVTLLTAVLFGFLPLVGFLAFGRETLRKLRIEKREEAL